jgi:hypothetical protein
MNDEEHLKNEVKEYVEASKNYKNIYKENVKAVIPSSKSPFRPELFNEDIVAAQIRDKRSYSKKDDYDGLWNCQRISD